MRFHSSRAATRSLATLVAAAALAAVPAGNARAQQTTASLPTPPGSTLPLTAARWSKFTTSKGTWMSLDVSPDGQRIVFDLLGDIYTMPIAGGKATRLTYGLPHDMQPRFSPDGRRIVFVSDRSGDENVWLMDADGKGVMPLTTGDGNVFFSPEWMPDGNYVVVSRTAQGLPGLEKLWLYHVRGGRGLEMTPGPAGIRMLGAAVGSDPRYVWFAQRNGTWMYNAILPQYQLGVYDRESGTRTTMSGRYGSAFRPAVSPDGKWLTYGSRHQAETGLRIRDIATGEERWLAYPIQRDDQESVASLDVLPGYSFTPDSRAVVISYGGEFWRVPVDGSAPAKIPFSADVEVAVGPEVKFEYPIEQTPTFTIKQIRDAVASPDGRRVAFSALDRLYVADLPNGTPRRLTTQDVGEYQPTWSPDGNSIAYVTWDEREGHIMRVGAGGGTPTRLTRAPAYYQQPAWAPDNRRIVAIRSVARELKEAIDPFVFEGLGAEFVWVPSAGGELTVIGSTGGRQKPHFTTDTSRIYSYGVFPADPQLVLPAPQFGLSLMSTRWDNTDLKQHLRVNWKPPFTPVAYEVSKTSDIMIPRDFSKEIGVPQAPVDLIMMAPRGDQAFALANNQVYTVTVPRISAAPPVVTLSRPDSAAVPIRKLSDIAAEFPSWSGDGRTVHWTIGNAWVSYRLDRADAVEDSLRRAGQDSLAQLRVTYKPEEVRIRATGERDTPRGTVVLRGARALTMKGREVIENADIVVRDNKIVSVGPRGEVPQGARVIDVTGKTITPGFVDTHSHMWNMWGLHWTRPWIYAANLAYGITTTRDPQTATTDVLTYADRVEAGQIVGPRIYSTGPGVFFEEGIKSLDDARHVLRRYSDYYDTKTFKMYMSGNRRQREWLIMAARELKLMPTTEGGLEYRLNMTHAMDGYVGIEHTMPVIPAYNDVIELFKTSGTTNTPTLLVAYGGPWAENYFYTHEDVVGDKKLNYFTPKEEINYKARRRNPGPGPGGWFVDDEYAFPKHAAWIKDLVEAGGHAGIGSHGQLQGLGYHWEMWAVAMGGINNYDLLRMATTLGAESIGLGKDLGTIEGGKLADLVVMDANPLDNIRNTNTVRYVMKNGRLYDGSTLNEMWPREKPAADEAWRHMGPTGGSVRGGGR